MDIIFKIGLENMNFDRVAQWLSGVYWSPGITRAEVVYGADHSTLVVGGFTQTDEQVSYLRVISDRVRFAYILDVVVAPSHRGHGIGKKMMLFTMEHPHLQYVYQWVLRTREAQEFYVQLGFKRVEGSDQWMSIQKPRPDRRDFLA